ncbi:DEAD/DEAH box helicase domain protein [Emticicia oligotrophica DSM 17448]|uniref:DEAD/DEAH box helicase domain protein n=1 Tax=Emticicia oligotrophica (strain DSM 17448 / CIP 109782 / MTCC 6937 / GPTSA100-15) TaxID=929562 RepID=A0ABM5MXU3_EMTOG|nr:DEAD/DEAH box helicase [Emticicia oligotrophica]AFK01956.1 DEAD/DEAH box helicase domain protein [Emticicia oligotrophica DSM 17448]
MKFDDYSISNELKRNIASLGFKRPTDIQFKSIPPILRGEDVLAIAQTGTGKTAAFAIPIISILQEMKHSPRYKEGVKCIVLEPTRELALQITQVFQKMAKGTKVETLCLFGGVEQAPQVEKIEKGVDILIATPGRMFDLIYQKHLKITGVEILVLDEADHMLDLGFIKDIHDVKKFLPKFHQTLFFSATINEQIKKIAYSLVRNPIRIQISPKDPVSKNITHSVAFVEMDDKRFFLERVVNENPESKILVFVRTKVRAERVKAAMQRVGIESETIHGDKEQENRLEVLDKFRNSEVKILIATDVTARGIDIADVDYVVNYDLPDVPENYVHRVGRTGRGMKKGLAVSFCSTEEKPILQEIENFMGKSIRVLELDSKEYSETIDFSKDTTNYDLKALLKEAEALEEMRKKNKKKK